ncbi:MAG: hypothetical protein CMLOHMNK_02999 [Steroidobacteraceae bacterium]|nr:hypothetical protein [Steroidobacteraceae bacterium]
MKVLSAAVGIAVPGEPRYDPIGRTGDEPPSGPETHAALHDCWSYWELNRCTADKPKPAQALLAYVSKRFLDPSYVYPEGYKVRPLEPAGSVPAAEA